MTAVEWLAQQLKSTYDNEGKLPLAYTLDLVRQAKQMEKEQIIDAFGIGCQVESTRLIGYHGKAEQYYKEMYCEYSGLPSVESYKNK